MSPASGLTRSLLGRLQIFGAPGAAISPTSAIRDPWPGDATQGARLLQRPDFFASRGTSAAMLAYLLGFSWLRHMRELGTDAARARAKNLVCDVLETPDDALAARPDIAGGRIAAWLGHYEFFAAGAGAEHRARLFARVVADAKTLAAALPADIRDGRALTAVKGLIAAATAFPEHAPFLPHATKLLAKEIGRQILPDGFHAERSPAAHLAALQDLIEIRALYQEAAAPPPQHLTPAIERMARALRAVLHPDGGLALFNGSCQGSAPHIDLVLAQAGGYTPTGHPIGAPKSLPHAGLYRLCAARTVLIMDAGPPPERGLDRLSHAGTLAFEVSSGRERLIVNAGAAPFAGTPWYNALRATPAHSTLTIGDLSSAELLESGLGRRPTRVTTTHGATWLQSSHDGYQKPFFGAIHHRRLTLSPTGGEIAGEDEILAPEPVPFAIRFHLHPAVTASPVQDQSTILLRLPSGQGWRLRAEGAAVSVEESVYFGDTEPRRAEQVVLNGPRNGPQLVKWAMTKLG